MERGDWKEVWERAGGIEHLQEVQMKWSPEREGEIISAKLLNTSQELESHSTALEKELGSGGARKDSLKEALFVGETLLCRKAWYL